MELIKNILQAILAFFIESMYTVFAHLLPFTDKAWIYYTMVAVYYVIILAILIMLWKSKKKRIFAAIVCVVLGINCGGFAMLLHDFDGLVRETFK